MRVLLVGSGGREHALAWALRASPLLTKLYCAPGNAGIEAVADCVAIAASDFEGLVAFAVDKAIDFAIIAADAQLVAGLWDRFEAAGIRASGPSKAGAILEGSKGFVKDMCRDAGIPTAAYRRFREPEAAKLFADSLGLPVVIKPDGLTAGKGVVVAQTQAESHKAIDFMFEGGFGESGHEVVVEEFMSGEEASFFALCDGENVIPLAGAQDHKQVFDGDKGQIGRAHV
jgi:phosphoribosylamine--glycine ligase